MPSVGETIPARLAAAGITHVFGIPGIHNVELYRGLPGSGLRHVTPRHEQGAGFMADGFARAAGRPAACFTITGPGLANILTAMGQAHGDSVPMLVVASVNPDAPSGRPLGRLHELRSQRDMAAGVAGFAASVRHPGAVDAAIAEAMASFAGRPRPAYVEIPTDVLAMPATEHGPAMVPETPRPDGGATMAAAAAALAAARTPVVILGGGAVGAASEVRRLVERLGAPTLLTVNARGILPGDHPLLAGANLASPVVRDLLAGADVVLAIGTELGETEMAPEPLPVVVPGTFIRVDIDPGQLALAPLAAIAVTADAGMFARAVSASLAAGAPAPGGPARAAATRSALEAAMPASYGPHLALFAALEAALPGHRLVGDSTKPVYTATEFLHRPAPRRFFSASTGFGTLGYALPAAIGAMIADPDVPAVALVGDGGLMFTLPELAVAVANRVPVVVVVWNNGGYAEIRDAMVAKGIAPLGVTHPSPDIAAIAAGFGCPAARARGIDEVVTLIRGRDAAMPFLVVVDEPMADRGAGG